jgi:hypothetical protein
MSDASDDCPALTAACRSSLLVNPSMCIRRRCSRTRVFIDAHAPR